MAFEKLKSAPGKFWGGVKEHFKNTGTGVVGGVLDAVRNGVTTVGKGIGNTFESILNAPTQMVVRGISAIKDFCSPSSAHFLDPRVAWGHMWLGVQRGYENFVEARRAVADTGFNLDNVFSRAIARTGAGFGGIDLAKHPRMGEATQSLAVEALESGEPSLGLYREIFSGKAYAAIEEEGSAQPGMQMAA